MGRDSHANKPLFAATLASHRHHLDASSTTEGRAICPRGIKRQRASLQPPDRANLGQRELTFKHPLQIGQTISTINCQKLFLASANPTAKRAPKRSKIRVPKMGPKKDNLKARGLWISPPRRWLFVLIPLLAVIAGGTFIGNSFVSEQFRYSLSEKFFNWPSNKDLADELGADKNSAFRPVEGPAKVFGGDDEKSKRPDDTASDLAAVRAELAKSIAAEEFARRQIAYLEKWLKDNEMMSTGALDAERERSDGIARDLAAVRSELADRITAEASARNEIAQLTKRLEASENEWTTRLTAERGSDSASLAAVRAELADSITAVASARTEIEQLTQRLATNEKDWTTKLDAERERSHGLARDLATVRAELAERIAAEASARGGILDLEKLSKANETEWTSRFPT